MLDRQTIEHAARLSGDAPIVIAVSGGGDSTALLHLMAEEFGAARLRALVVDHALRAGSVDDARKAAGFAEKLGVDAEVTTLSWDGPPASSRHCFSLSPASRLEAGGPIKRNQQNARRLRYSALCDAARACGARVICVAHNADDQAETVFMRAGAGSSWRGLAGMALLAPAPLWPEGRAIVLARPLLNVRRAALRDALRARGAEWIEDPANANAAFERVRVRAHLTALEEAGLAPMRFVQLAARMRPLVESVDAEAAALIEGAARFDAEVIMLSLSAWGGGAEARLRALSLLIGAAAGADREPDAEPLARLEARLTGSGFRGASLGGARLARRGETIRFSRDAGAVLGRAGGAAALPEINLPMQREIVWDGRLALVAEAAEVRLRPAAGAPAIVYNGLALSLDDAAEAGLVRAHWLLEQHIVHRLGPFSTIKPVNTNNSPATFTAP